MHRMRSAAARWCGTFRWVLSGVAVEKLHFYQSSENLADRTMSSKVEKVICRASINRAMSIFLLHKYIHWHNGAPLACYRASLTHASDKERKSPAGVGWQK